MPTLRMTKAEARLLAGWLKWAAERSDAEAQRLRKATILSDAQYYADMAARIRALAQRLEG